MDPIRHRPDSLRLAASAALLAIASAAAGQELALPAVDDSPSAQLLVEQASDQARGNPREAVRLLVEALDAGHDRLVRSASDPDLYLPVMRRVHAMLAGDAALRAAFRQEVSADAESRLARGDLEWTASRRLDTEAGLEASLRLAQSAVARGRFAAAAAWLDRVADHDLLAGRRALHHAALSAVALARVGDEAGAAAARARLEGPGMSGDPAIGPAELAAARAAAAPAAMALRAAGPLGMGIFREPVPAAAWSQTWSVPLDAGAAVAVPYAGAPAERAASAPRSAPAVVGERVFVDDGGSIRGLDLLTGRVLWSAALGGGGMQAGPRLVAASADAVIAFPEQPFGMGRPAPGRVACIDPASGAVRWDDRLDQLGGGTDLDGLQPQGSPLIVDGRAIVAARRTSARLETASWLVALDLERPQPAAWIRSISTSGSVRVGTQRSADSPVLEAGVLCIATATGAVAAIDPWDGLVRWLRRFPVPVRDAAAQAAPAEVMTPAVVGGALWAVSPDRSRIRAFALRDGAPVAEVVTGSESDVGTPAYLVGDPASGILLAVGDRVARIDPAAPAHARWSVPGPDAPQRQRVHGRIQLAATTDPAAPVVLVPEEDDAVVLDARSGIERMRLPGAGDANAVLAGTRMVSASASALSGWMPAEEAERTVRARMASSPEVAEAIGLLHLARQLRSGRLAADGAEEAVARARALPAGASARAELLELLLAIDALDVAHGPDRERLDGAVDACAAAFGTPARAGLIRADRALRRGLAPEAARRAVAAALSAPAGLSLPIRGGGSASPHADARRIVDAARRLGDPAAVASAVESAILAASDAGRRPDSRAVARLGVGTPSGDAALAATTAAATSPPERAAAARLALECRALGAGGAAVGRAFAAAVPDVASILAAPAAAVPKVDGRPARIVEFQGRLPRMPVDVRDPPGSLLVLQGTDLLLRTMPGCRPAWRVPIRCRDASVLATAPDIIVCDDSPGGSGSVTCVSPAGAVRWSTPPAAIDVAEPVETAEGGDPRSMHLPAVVAMATAPTVAVLRHDGSIVAYARDRGNEAWSLPAAGIPAMAWAADPLAVAVGRESESSAGAAIEVSAFDAASGTPIGTWSPDAAAELRWIRIVDGSLLVIATDAGIEARRLAGGDEHAPYWSIDSVETRGTLRSWSVGDRLLVLDRFDSLLTIDPWTGRVIPGAFSAPSVSSPGAVREVAVGGGWVASVRDDRIDFFSPQGAFLGRDAPAEDRSYVDAAASADRLFALDGGGAGSDGVPMRFSILLRDLDGRRGGMEPEPPTLLRSLGQRIGAVGTVPGAVIAANGSVVQVIECSESPPGPGR